MRNLWLFIRYIPAFYRLWKEWGTYPDHIDFALRQYIGVISELTGGKLSKICYGATYILDEIRENYCDGCEYREGEQE